MWFFLTFLFGLLACSQPATTPTTTPQNPAPVVLRLGYCPNLTHATALVGIGKGLYVDALGPAVKLETSLFNAVQRPSRRSSPTRWTRPISVRILL